MTRTPAKWAALTALLVLYTQCSFPDVTIAASGSATLGPIKIAPAAVMPGQYPDIAARLSQTSTAKDAEVNIIAVVTQPDSRIKSWNWKKVKLSGGVAKEIVVPKEYGTLNMGTYRVEILVYSDDMKRRIARRFSSFAVVGRQQKEGLGKKMPSGTKEGKSIDTEEQKRKRSYLGLGLYGNALNPAAGGTLFLWPSKYVGVQGVFSTGAFTSYEGRLLLKADWSSKYAFYCGAGYMHVTAEKDVIGAATTFEDGAISGVLGVEVSLGEKSLLYIEASSARIKLERTVTNGAQTVIATVKHAPVTIGVSLVIAIF